LSLENLFEICVFSHYHSQLNLFVYVRMRLILYMYDEGLGWYYFTGQCLWVFLV